MISWGAFRFTFPEGKTVFISAFSPSVRGVRLIRRFCGKTAPPSRVQPRPACNSWRSHPLTADVDGATAGSYACNQIPALDAVGHDAEEKNAEQKWNKYTAIFGFAGVERLMFETAVLLELELFSSTS